MSAYLPVGLILFMLATGCESPSGPMGLTVTDSAGVRIIELGPDLEGVAERRVLADEPDWVIRSREDDPSFVVSKVMDVELLSQGRIAIADEVGNEIFVFDSEGRHVATWGGVGDGPGEFRRLAWLAFKPPDSLGAGDFRLFRVTVLDANGRFVRNVETASAMTRSAGTVPARPIGLLSDGSVVTAVFESAAPVEGSQRPGVEVAVIPPSVRGRRRRGRHLGGSSVFARGYLRTVVRSTVSPTAVSDRLLEERITEKYRHVSPGPGLEGLKADQRGIAGQCDDTQLREYGQHGEWRCCHRRVSGRQGSNENVGGRGFDRRRNHDRSSGCPGCQAVGTGLGNRGCERRAGQGRGPSLSDPGCGWGTRCLGRR